MLLNRISIDPKICLGQPTVRGTRITISVVLKLLAEGRSEEEIIAAYPELQPDDIRQSLLYAAWLASDRAYDLQSV